MEFELTGWSDRPDTYSILKDGVIVRELFQMGIKDVIALRQCLDDRIHFGTPEDMGKRFIDAWHRAQRGEEVNETHITMPPRV